MPSERRAAETAVTEARGERVGDLVAIARTPAVISLSDLAHLRDRLAAGAAEEEALAALLSDYHLGEPETRAAFEALLRALTREGERGDAFSLAGVYGAGKSHLLAALVLLCGEPEAAWPVFLRTHPNYTRAARAFPTRRLVVPIALDAYPAQSHPLEYVVFSALERELAQRHGVRVALTEEAHLLHLVQEYVYPQHGAELESLAQEAAQQPWAELCQQAPLTAAPLALACLQRVGFPLDWRRSRAEAWATLRAALREHALEGPLLLLDELGLFLAGKDRAGLNADASFLQYLAQLTATDRSWLVGVTQRGMTEVGDIDRRTLRQMRDRFRTAFTLDLADLGWVVAHKLVRKHAPESFPHRMAELHADYRATGGELTFTAEELARAYPLNPLCLDMIRAAAETCLSRTRSVTRLLQEAALERDWLDRPAASLITPEAAFDLLEAEMAYSPEGRKVQTAVATLTANAGGIAPGREAMVVALAKTLGLLWLGGLRWPVARVRSSLVGGPRAELWQAPARLPEVLAALYRRGGAVERARGEGEESDCYFLDLDSTANERLRQRLSELLAELAPGDTRVARAALEACTEPGFPLAALQEVRALPVDWHNVRRLVLVSGRDLTGLKADDLANLLGGLASPELREDGALYLALPGEVEAQARAWQAATADLQGRFVPALLAWRPRPLTATEQDHLVEHAALAHMAADPTLATRREADVRDKLRARLHDSVAEVSRLLQRAYHAGRIVDAQGETVVAPERLASFVGDWEGVLSAAFAAPFDRLFPRFAEIAPARRLSGRGQTNQIIDEFIRPGQAQLPPASALEAHLRAYAAPLGLAEEEGRGFRLVLQQPDLVQAALAAAPERGEEITPDSVIAFGAWAGRLGKGEWGLAREQLELLAAALLRTGHLVALDAFLQPLRFEAVAAPLGEFLPYVMRALPLPEPEAGEVRALWSAATGRTESAWTLPAQEQAWRELLAWAGSLRLTARERREAMARAATDFDHDAEAWAPVLAYLARAEALTETLEAALPSREGLARLAEGAARLPGGTAATAEAVRRWREGEAFLRDHLPALVADFRLLIDPRLVCPEQALLASSHRAARARFAAPEEMVADPHAAREAAASFLEAYRRHYLAWHERVHAAPRFDALLQVRRGAEMEVVRSLARAGVAGNVVARLESEFGRALGRRCHAGDPLPVGHVVCPLCGLPLGQEVELPTAEEIARQVGTVREEQRAELAPARGLLLRRAGAQPRITEALAVLLAEPPGTAQAEAEALTEEVIAWIREHHARPAATPRRLGELGARLAGREVTRGEVRRAVEEWLGPGENDLIEVVP